MQSAHAQLGDLVECMKWQPAGLDYAFVDYTQGGVVNVWMADHMHYDLPNGLREPDIRRYRRLLPFFAPDAFAVQVLTDAHLDRAHDMRDWVVEELAPGRHLVTARDLEHWLATPPPHPENQYRMSPPPPHVTAKARADFGEMLLTRETANELEPH